MDEQRKEITIATSKLFMQYGIKSVSMDDVARNMSISKKTLYKYFKDKTDLVANVIACPAHGDFNEMSELKKMNTVERHIAISNSVVEFLKDMNPSFEYDLEKYYPKLFKEVIEARRKAMFESMKTQLKRGVEEGFFRDDLDIELVTLLNILRIESLRKSNLLEMYKRDIMEAVKEYFSYDFHAIATPKGLKEYKRLMKENKNG